MRRHDEYVAERAPDEFVAASADGAGALDINIDQDIDSTFQVGHERLPEGAVIMLVHARVFEELALLHPREELCFGDKVIVLATDFAGPRLAGRAGNGI